MDRLVTFEHGEQVLCFVLQLKLIYSRHGGEERKCRKKCANQTSSLLDWRCFVCWGSGESIVAIA